MIEMTETARKPFTWVDLLATPDDGKTYEIIGGELEASPRPLPIHGLAQSLLSGELSPPFQRRRGGPGGWWLIIEPDVELGPHDIVVPDVVGWRVERMPELPRTRPIQVIPDWICEVLSPSSKRRDRITKADLYLESGVPFYWILDVEERTLEAYAAKEGSWSRLGAWTDGATPRVPPFDAIELDVGGLFPPPRVEPSSRES